MPVVTLPDGSSRSYENPVSIADVAADIGPGLAKAALAGKVDGRLVDTSHTVSDDVELAIITGRSDEALELIRLTDRIEGAIDAVRAATGQAPRVVATGARPRWRPPGCARRR